MFRPGVDFYGEVTRPGIGVVCQTGWDAPARAGAERGVRAPAPCARGAPGPRQTMGAGGEQGGRGGSAHAPPRPGKQVTPDQPAKQMPK